MGHLTNDTRLPVGDVLSDPFENGWFRVQVIDRNVEKTCITIRMRS